MIQTTKPITTTAAAKTIRKVLVSSAMGRPFFSARTVRLLTLFNQCNRDIPPRKRYSSPQEGRTVSLRLSAASNMNSQLRVGVLQGNDSLSPFEFIIGFPVEYP